MWKQGLLVDEDKLIGNENENRNKERDVGLVIPAASWVTVKNCDQFNLLPCCH
jgi:hypothetical protein